MSTPTSRLSGTGDGATAPISDNRPPGAVPKPSHDRRYEGRFLGPTDDFWSQYLAVARKEDGALVEGWKGEADAILIFTGLFAATVAAFATQTYPLLSPSSDDISAEILLQISAQLAAAANGSEAAMASPPAFQTPAYVIRVNILLFLSLFVSLFCALLATLMHRWTRRYTADVDVQASTHTRGRLHVLLSMGVHRFKFSEVVGVIVALLHIAVILFIAGIAELLLSADPVVSALVLSVGSVFGVSYVLLSLLPFFSPSAPYDTPLTSFLRHCLLVLRPLDVAYRYSKSTFADALLYPFYRLFQASQPRRSRLKNHLAEYGVSTYGARYALGRVNGAVDENHELESLIAGFHSFCEHEPHINRPALLTAFFDDDSIRSGLLRLMDSCRTRYSTAESTTVRIRRLLVVLKFLRNPDVDSLLRQPLPISFSLHALIRHLRQDKDSRISFLTWTLQPDIEWVSGCPALANGAFGYRKHWSARNHSSLEVFIRCACTILHFAALPTTTTTTGAHPNSVQMYRSEWEPIARRLCARALADIKIESDLNHRFVSPTLADLLRDAGMDGFVYASPPRGETRHPPHDFTQGLRALPSPLLTDLLCELAERLPAQPPRPWVRSCELATELDASVAGLSPTSVERDGAERKDPPWCMLLVTSPTQPRPVSVCLGPLTWGRRPASEFLALLNSWQNEIKLRYQASPSWNRPLDTLRIKPLWLSAWTSVRVIEDHVEGKGYAAIEFRDGGMAASFVETWMKGAPWRVEGVTAKIWVAEEDAEP